MLTYATCKGGNRINITKRKLIVIGAVYACICILAWATILQEIRHGFEQVEVSTRGIGLVTTIHSTITFYKNGILLYRFEHPGEVTNIGLNFTLYKLFGNSTWQYADLPYLDNATYISIGNQGALSQASTVLPGEWNRTEGTISKNTGQSTLNITCTFYPDAGPYTTDCFGLNLNSTAGANNLWGYDTCPEVTGIDDTFTIVVEMQVAMSS